MDKHRIEEYRTIKKVWALIHSNARTAARDSFRLIILSSLSSCFLLEMEEPHRLYLSSSISLSFFFFFASTNHSYTPPLFHVHNWNILLLIIVFLFSFFFPVKKIKNNPVYERV